MPTSTCIGHRTHQDLKCSPRNALIAMPHSAQTAMTLAHCPMQTQGSLKQVPQRSPTQESRTGVLHSILVLLLVPHTPGAARATHRNLPSCRKTRGPRGSNRHPVAKHAIILVVRDARVISDHSIIMGVFLSFSHTVLLRSRNRGPSEQKCVTFQSTHFSNFRTSTPSVPEVPWPEAPPGRGSPT